ncbi:MAG: NmrA/HSCARG family protein [Calditrichia bacterium]
MNNKKIITVVGATGAQGGGLAKAILNDPQSEFSVRALTRKPDSEKAQALAAAGAEVVAADLDDQSSLEKAFAGSYGAYCVTNFWEHFSPEKELQQAQNLATAAKAAGVQHVIWSTLEDTRRWVPLTDDRMPTLMGKYKVPHFDAKGEANHFFSDLGVPTTFLHTSFYWDNLIHFGMGPQKGEDGKLYFTLPMDDKKLPGMAVADIGKCAYGIFKAGPKYIGKTVGITGEHLTGEEMAAALSKALGQPVFYNAVTPAAYRGFGFPGAEDLGNMFQFKMEFEQDFCELRNLAFSRSLNPSLLSFQQWLAQNINQIAIA